MVNRERNGTVLVVGATGMLGEPVARRLAADGQSVRVMSRDRDRVAERFDGDEENFEIVQANVEDVDSLRSAMAGCTGVHINLSGGVDFDLERQGVENVSRIAAELNIERLTYISGAGTCEENAWFPGAKAKLGAEQAIKESGVSYTIFRCTMFMETLPMFVRDGRATIIGHQPNKWHFVAAEDYAAMVSKAYITPETANKTLYIYGPRAYTMEAALRIYVAICDPEATISTVPLWVMRIISWMPGQQLLRKVVVPLMHYFSKVGEPEGAAAEANELLGAPATTLKDWSEKRREA